jgi:hypothetical protein
MLSSLRLATHRQELAAHASLRPAPASTPLPSYFPLPPLTDFDVPLTPFRLPLRQIAVTMIGWFGDETFYLPSPAQLR